MMDHLVSRISDGARLGIVRQVLLVEATCDHQHAIYATRVFFLIELQFAVVHITSLVLPHGVVGAAFWARVKLVSP